jgi:two-component system response regulator ResD
MDKSILIIEDDEDLRTLYQISLQKVGFTIHIAENGLEGVNTAVSEKGIDLILLDMMMPMSDGRDVLSMLQLHTHVQNTPVIVISNLDVGTVDLSGFDDQVIDYWIKSDLSPTLLTEKLVTYFS